MNGLEAFRRDIALHVRRTNTWWIRVQSPVAVSVCRSQPGLPKRPEMIGTCFGAATSVALRVSWIPMDVDDRLGIRQSFKRF
jgi:hypothetical protein